MPWDPLRELQAWHERLGRHQHDPWSPPIDVYETGDTVRHHSRGAWTHSRRRRARTRGDATHDPWAPTRPSRLLGGDGSISSGRARPRPVRPHVRVCRADRFVARKRRPFRRGPDDHASQAPRTSGRGRLRWVRQMARRISFAALCITPWSSHGHGPYGTPEIGGGIVGRRPDGLPASSTSDSGGPGDRRSFPI